MKVSKTFSSKGILIPDVSRARARASREAGRDSHTLGGYLRGPTDAPSWRPGCGCATLRRPGVSAAVVSAYLVGEVGIGRRASPLCPLASLLPASTGCPGVLGPAKPENASDCEMRVRFRLPWCTSWSDLCLDGFARPRARAWSPTDRGPGARWPEARRRPSARAARPWAPRHRRVARAARALRRHGARPGRGPRQGHGRA